MDSLPGAAQPQVLVLATQQDQLRVVVDAESVPRRAIRVEPHLREPPPHDARAPPQPRPLPEVHHPAREQPRRRRYCRREGTSPRRAEQRRREEHERPGDADDSEAQLRGSMSGALARVLTDVLNPFAIFTALFFAVALAESQVSRALLYTGVELLAAAAVASYVLLMRRRARVGDF